MGHADGHSGGFHFRAETQCLQHASRPQRLKARRRAGKAADGWAIVAAFSCQLSAKPVYEAGHGSRMPPLTKNVKVGEPVYCVDYRYLN